MQILGNNILEEQAITGAIVADILKPQGKQEQIDESIQGSEMILDFSASVPVARHLSALGIGPRRASAFLNSDATDVVVLTEDLERKIPLDCLEMQYYRGILSMPELMGHLAEGNMGRVRYAQSCRDLTSTIPEELVGLHSAIVARGVRSAAENSSASISVWRSSPNMSVTAVTIIPSAVREVALGDWRIRTDEILVERLKSLRRDRLPNETGGVLIGSFNLERKIIYIVDTVPSPPDSTEWPVLYIRGCEGLPERIESIQEATLGMLQYVGEWHSHPNGCSTEPSNDDLKVFSWLTGHMSGDGLPAVMSIVGEAEAMSWFVGSIVPAS
jgi:integrative and conjugative element protein (TIGR02256 family)